MSEYVPYSGIPVILSTISLSTCMVPPHYIRGGTPLLSLIKTLEFISTVFIMPCSDPVYSLGGTPFDCAQCGDKGCTSSARPS